MKEIVRPKGHLAETPRIMCSYVETNAQHIMNQLI